MTVRARLGGATALMAALILVGCRPVNPNAPARVTGRVMYNGSPVTGGSVSFHFKEGGMVSAAIGGDGNYSAIDIPTGEATVTVETESINPDKKKVDYGRPGGPAGVGGPMYGKKGGGGPKAPPGKGAPASPAPEGASTDTTYMKIPAKYAAPGTSGLTITVKEGKQSHDITLSD